MKSHHGTDTQEDEVEIYHRVLEDDHGHRLLEYVSVARFVRENSFADAVLALRRWHILSRRIYGALGIAVGIGTGILLRMLLG